MQSNVSECESLKMQNEIRISGEEASSRQQCARKRRCSFAAFEAIEAFEAFWCLAASLNCHEHCSLMWNMMWNENISLSEMALLII